MANIPQNKHSVHVRFVLGSSYNARSKFRDATTIGTIRHSIGDISDVSELGIRFILDEKPLEDSTTLEEIAESPFVPVEVELNFPNSELDEQKFRDSLPTLEVITVHPQYGKRKNITVIIEDHACTKQWLGGYCNKLSGKKYHHAVAQTSPEYTRVTDKPVPLKFHRDTQTAATKTRGTATVESRGTQMWRRDCCVTTDTDKIIVAKKFKPYRSENEQIDAHARVIQRFWKQFKIRNVIAGCIGNVQQEEEKRRTLLGEIAFEHSVEERGILTGAVFPSKRDDFHLLHLVLGQWVKKMWNINNMQRTECSKKAKLYLMLTKEINCLSMIEKHKIAHKEQAVKREDVRFLEVISRPKVFKNKNGKLVSLYDIETERARELKEIHSELVKKGVKATDRITFLNTLKNMFTTNFSAYEFASDIVSLIDREIRFITMGMKNKDLKGVRMRIEQLFLHFVKQEEFNPKAKKYEKANMPHAKHQEYQCARCRKQLPVSKFPVHFRMNNYSVCTSCKWLCDIGLIHFDLAPYKKLLKQVRHEELDKCSHSAPCFLLQPPGMAYLTMVVWHNRSAVSESAVMSKLRHVRWLRDFDWSPWNTVLLTAEEAEYHGSIPDVNQFYGPAFVSMVHSRHLLARSHFKGLEQLNHSLCLSGKWNSAEQSDLYFQKLYAHEFIAEDNFDFV